MQKKLLSVMALGLLATTLNASADQASQAAANAANAPLLFVQMAQAATLTADAKAPNTYTLTLNNVNSKVLWFNDRPGRASGSVGIQKFIAVWSNKADANNFKLDHPNAALISMAMEADDNANELAPVFTLSQPSYNAAQHSMTYQAVLVKGSDKPLNLNMKDVTVFIDTSAKSNIQFEDWS